MEKIKNISTIILISAFLFGLSGICWFHDGAEYSVAERRYLKQFPEMEYETIMSGKFMSEFETYVTDQFPARDAFRGIKTAVALSVFAQKENNGLYLADGYINKVEYPYHPDSITHAAKVLNGIYAKYLEGTACNVYYGIIPDKGYFLSQANGYPAMDYEQLEADFTEAMSQVKISNSEDGTQLKDAMTYINLFDVMQLDDFYKTDTHWRQEEISDVAAVIAEAMGKELDAKYEICQLSNPFYGVYHGQLALPKDGETLYYLTNDVLNECKVFDYANGKKIGIYNFQKAEGNDPYEMYLSGSLSLITIENPNSENEDELVIFRDSFGSSIAPLFVEEYRKITLVDIRYIHSGFLGNYIKFDNQDVLFLYSTMVLNNSETLK